MDAAQIKTISANSGPLPYDVVVRRIQQIETDYDLLQYEVDGWCAWPLLRFDVAYELARVTAPAKEGLRPSEKLGLALSDLVHLAAPRRARIVAKTYSSARAEQVGERYKDLYFDDLLVALGSSYKIESINNKHFLARGRAALIPSDLTTNLFELMGNRLAFTLDQPKHIQAVASRLAQVMQSELKLEKFSPAAIAFSLKRFYWLKRLYAWLFRRVQPQVLLVADPGEYILNAAAKELGIRVIELQHGMVDTHSFAYSWPAYALPYKDRMPIPDRIFLYGEYWRQKLALPGFWGDTLQVVGSLRVDQYRERRSQAARDREVCRIVWASDGVSVPESIAFFSDFLRLAEGKLAYELTVKLHPVYETEKAPYEAAFGANPHVHILSGSEPPSTFELLAQADVHISIASTCHFEALSLGVPTVILPLFPTYEAVLPIQQSGHASLATTPQDLLQIVLQSWGHEVPPEIGEHYFRANALAAMKQEIETTWNGNGRRSSQ